MINRTNDGYTWNRAQGTKHGGLKCRGVIEPARKLGSSPKIYDVIVVGAGYAGLRAARDLATSSQFFSPFFHSFSFFFFLSRILTN